MSSPRYKARALVLSTIAAVAGCQISVPPSQLHPSVASALASPEDSVEAREKTVLQTAASDLECDRVSVVMTFDRRYSNSASLRYLVEGCGQRAMYAETCETYPHCRYLLASVIAVPSAVPSQRDAAPAQQATPSP